MVNRQSLNQFDLPGDPTADDQAATKAYVDGRVGSITHEGVYPLKEGYGYHSASGDPLQVSTAYSDLPGYITRIWVPRGCQIATVGVLVSTAGTLGAGGLNGLAVYDDDGLLLGNTASDSTIWTTVGLNVRNLITPIAPAPRGRFVWVMANIQGISPLPFLPYITGRTDVFNIGPRRRAAYSNVPVSSWPASINPDTWGTGSNNFSQYIVLGGADMQQYAVDTSGTKYLPVTAGAHFNGNGGATVTGLIQTRCRQTRKLLRVIAGGADKLQVEWANIWTSNIPQANDASCEIAGPNNVTVRMAIEYPAGNPRLTSGSAAWASATAYAVNDQVTHAGSRWVAIQAGTNQTPAAGSAYWRKVNAYLVRWDGETDSNGTVVFAPGDYKKSQPISLSETVRAGDMLAVLGAFDSGSGTNRIPYAGSAGASNTAPFVDWVVDAAGGMPAFGAGLVDTGVTTQTNGTTTPANSTNESNWMKIPYVTVVTGNVPGGKCLGIFGDSLIAGSGDITEGEPAGLFLRAMAAFPGGTFWEIAQGGNKAGCYVPGNAPWQMSVVSRCSAIVTDLGLNDIQENLTTAVVKARMQKLWETLAAQGPPVYSGLLTPISNSTDSWATTANQSRWTGGGSVNSTQFPTDDATWLTSVYGQIQAWLGQDGAELSIAGVTTKAGIRPHPLTQILTWKTLIADPSTSWKWVAGYTADGAHPNTAAATVAGVYLSSQMKGMVDGQRTAQAQDPVLLSSHGADPVNSMSRSEISSVASPTTQTLFTVIGISPGRWYYGIRVWSGTAVASTRSWSLLIGADAAKMKCVGTGSQSFSASTMTALSVPGAPLWIPAGYVIGLALTTGGVANCWGGRVLTNAGVAVDGLNFVQAGGSADTGALTVGTTYSMYNAAKWTPNTFRVYAAIY